MAAFHVRNIPEDLHAKLRLRAARSGRSMNAEIVAILERELDGPDPEEFMRELREIQSRIRLGPDAPNPEDLIRQDRDSDHGRL